MDEMIDLLNVSGFEYHDLAVYLLAQAGIPPCENAGPDDQYCIDEFKIDVHETVIVNRGERHVLRVVKEA